MIYQPTVVLFSKTIHTPFSLVHLDCKFDFGNISTLSVADHLSESLDEQQALFFLQWMDDMTSTGCFFFLLSWPLLITLAAFQLTLIIKKKKLTFRFVCRLSSTTDFYLVLLVFSCLFFCYSWSLSSGLPITPNINLPKINSREYEESLEWI